MSGIDNAKLKQVKRATQLAALISLVVFVALIIVTGSRLVTLRSEVAGVEQELADKSRDLDGKRKELAELERKVNVLRELYGEMAQENPGLARSATATVLEANPLAAEILPRVYIHIRDERQRAMAAVLGKALERAGFVVPGIERLVNVGPDRSELRYFRTNETEVTDAERAAEALRAAGLPITPKFVTGYESSSTIRARHYELWLAPDFAMTPA